jgi:hypothetical protein
LIVDPLRVVEELLVSSPGPFTVELTNVVVDVPGREKSTFRVAVAELTVSVPVPETTPPS